MYIVPTSSQKISDKNGWACMWSMSFGILKLASNVEKFIYFFVYYLIKKRKCSAI